MGQMIVTCDHCGTRYKLDESKIPGRGARVNCPSCKHVFVVYRKIDGAAPEAPEAPPAEAPLSVDKEIAGLDPDSIDFRSVGISSWKVKAKIGLVYDFNDFKTIDKYIREGRVSGSDLLSHDGESWIPIDEIADLRRHFCEVYVRERHALEQIDDEDDFDEEEPTRIMSAPSALVGRPRKLSTPGTNNLAAPKPTPKLTSSPDSAIDLASAIAEASADVSSPTNKPANKPIGPRFVDPFESKRNSASQNSSSNTANSNRTTPRLQSPPSPPRRGSGTTIMIVLATLTLLGGGLFIAIQSGGSGSSGGRLFSPNPPSENVGTAGDIIEELKQEIRDRAEPVEDDAMTDKWGVPVEQELIPIRPGEARSGPQDDGLNGGTFSASQKTSSDHASDARSAANRGDWASASSSYQQAARMEPGNLLYVVEQGRAQYKAGQLSDANTTLRRAKDMGATEALRLLGDIAYDQGDNSGAMAHYQNYLRSNPPDRAQVELRIEQISGG
jgi:predicted Zn finger-like uncharacterized protein